MEGDYEGKWERVKAEVWNMNRTIEGKNVAMARVHVVQNDRAVRVIGYQAFNDCGNVVKVTAPFVEEVE